MNSHQSESTSPPQGEISSPSNMETVPAAMTPQVTNPTTTLIANHDVVTGTSVSHGAFRPISFLPTLTITMASYVSYTGPTSLIPAVTYEPLPIFFIAPFMTTPDGESSRAVSLQFAISRLPKLTLPTFSGDPLTWQTFWDAFNAAIHVNPSLSGVKKIQLFKGTITR